MINLKPEFQHRRQSGAVVVFLHTRLFLEMDQTVYILKNSLACQCYKLYVYTFIHIKSNKKLDIQNFFCRYGLLEVKFRSRGGKTEFGRLLLHDMFSNH